MTEPRLRPDQISALRTMLTATVENDAPRTRTPRAPRHPGLVVLAIGAVAAVAAAITIVVPGLHRTDRPERASDMLRAAAAATVAPEIEDGQYLKLETRAAYLAVTSLDGRTETTIGYLESQVREVYVSSDSSDEQIAHVTKVEPTQFFGEGAQEFAAERWDESSTALVSLTGPDTRRRPAAGREHHV
jgi:hypothetical protein